MNCRPPVPSGLSVVSDDAADTCIDGEVSMCQDLAPERLLSLPIVSGGVGDDTGIQWVSEDLPSQ